MITKNELETLQSLTEMTDQFVTECSVKEFTNSLILSKVFKTEKDFKLFVLDHIQRSVREQGYMLPIEYDRKEE